MPHPYHRESNGVFHRTFSQHNAILPCFPVAGQFLCRIMVLRIFGNLGTSPAFGHFPRKCLPPRPASSLATTLPCPISCQASLFSRDCFSSGSLSYKVRPDTHAPYKRRFAVQRNSISGIICRINFACSGKHRQ